MKLPRGMIFTFRAKENFKGTEIVMEEQELITCKDCIYRDSEDCKWREDESPDDDDYCSIACGKE